MTDEKTDALRETADWIAAEVEKWEALAVPAKTNLYATGANLLAQIDKLMPLIEGAIADAWRKGNPVNGPQFGGAVEAFREALASADTHPQGGDAKQGSVHG